MSTFTSMQPDLIDPLEKDIFYKRYKMWPAIYPQVFNIKSSTKAYEDAMKVSGLGTFALKPEGAPVSYDDPVSGPRRRVTHSTYALGFRVTMEMLQDDQFDIIKQMPSDLADSAKDHRENLAWGLFNDAFTGATYTGLDGLSLCNTSHTYLKFSGVQSNMQNPGVALSVTGLEAIMTQARTLRDESGRRTPVRLGTLLIPPALEHLAYQLLESEKEPFTADNQVNSVKRSRSGLGAVAVPFFTDTDAWFLTTSKDQHSLTWYDRMKLTMDSEKDGPTKDRLYDACYRASVCFRDWRGVWGSNP